MSAGPAASNGVRLQKLLAARGLGSRRQIEDAISAGRVKVNGEVAVLGRRVDTQQDRVELDGIGIGLGPDRVYYLLNKPRDVLSTSKDPHGRRIVTELVPARPRVFPVGRLDRDTEGLLLLTNDGELTHRLTHPSFGIEKEYVVELDAKPSRGDLRAWREGIELDDGPTASAKASLIAPKLLKLTIHEGRNRQVRRMCAARGLEVTRLVRTRIGPLADKNLLPGRWRHLQTDEVNRLTLNNRVGLGESP